MASNRLPDKRDRLFSLCDENIKGLLLYETVLIVKQNTEAVLTPALAAARGAEVAFGEAGVAKKTANAAVTAADNAGKVFIINARKRLSKFYGDTYTMEWGAAGWADNSLAMPSIQEDRYNLLQRLKTHFTNHPDHESEDMDATAALATTLYTAFNDARAVLGQKITANGIAKAARDAAEANLRKRMNGLVGELETLMSGDDPRWHAFGLSRPADEETPEAPNVLTVAAGGPGILLPDWDDALRADSYRVWLWIVGTDTEFHPVLTVHDSDATLPNLPSGATVKIQITSKNQAGESAPSAIVETVVP